MELSEKVREFITERFGDALLREEGFRGQQEFYVRPDAVYPICEALLDEDELDVRFLSDICSVDWLGHDEEKNGRFEVIYNLYSLKYHHRFFLKVRLPAENPEIPSLTPLFSGANWLEREVFDLFGVVFTGHPNLTKILTPDDLEGFPLRKDFPLTWEQPRFSWNRDDPPEVIK